MGVTRHTIFRVIVVCLTYRGPKIGLNKYLLGEWIFNIVTNGTSVFVYYLFYYINRIQIKKKHPSM